MANIKKLVERVLAYGPESALPETNVGVVKTARPDGGFVISVGGQEKNVRAFGGVAAVAPGQRVMVSKISGARYITGVLNNFENTRIRKVVIDA